MNELLENHIAIFFIRFAPYLDFSFVRKSIALCDIELYEFVL